MKSISEAMNGLMWNREPDPPHFSHLIKALNEANTARVRELCALGVNVNADTGIGYNHESMFTFIAAAAVKPGKAQDALDCFQTLLDHGLVLTRENKFNLYRDTTVLAPLVPEVRDAVALRDALAASDAAALGGLLAEGLDINCGLAYGADPAIITAAQKGDVAVIDLLLAHGASTHTKIWNDTSTMPLHQAALHGKRDAFVRLLNAGADPGLIWSNNEGLWSVNGMAKKCKTDPGMAKFVEDILAARNADAAPEVSVNHAISIRRPIAFKS